MRTRLLKPKTQVSRAPTTPQEWDNLMRKVIARATAMGDRRLQGLRGLISQGKSAKHLKMLGIVCENDILREFPDPKM